MENGNGLYHSYNIIIPSREVSSQEGISYFWKSLVKTLLEILGVFPFEELDAVPQHEKNLKGRSHVFALPLYCNMWIFMYINIYRV